MIREDKKRSSSILRPKKTSQFLKAISKGAHKTWGERIHKSWKSIDVYGRKIEFTFKGQKRYKTVFGATFTLI